MNYIKKYWHFLILIILGYQLFKKNNRTKPEFLSEHFTFEEFGLKDVNEKEKILLLNAVSDLEKIREHWDGSTVIIDNCIITDNTILVYFHVPITYNWSVVNSQQYMELNGFIIENKDDLILIGIQK